MTQWTNEELNKIGKAEELEIAAMRGDGTLCKPVIVWVVRVDDEFYVRSYKGQAGKWYRATLVRHEGRIRAGGVEKDITFVEVSDPATNDQVDLVYRVKYRRHPAEYVDPMVAPAVRLTTIKLVPR